jgi:hypothetical protein
MRADGLPTHGGAVELAVRLAEHGECSTEPAVKSEIKMEVKVDVQLSHDGMRLSGFSIG